MTLRGKQREGLVHFFTWLTSNCIKVDVVLCYSNVEMQNHTQRDGYTAL